MRGGCSYEALQPMLEKAVGWHSDRAFQDVEQGGHPGQGQPLVLTRCEGYVRTGRMIRNRDFCCILLRLRGSYK